MVAALAVGAVVGALLVRRRLTPALERTRTELSRRLDELFSLQELSYILSESLQVKRIAEQITGYLDRFSGASGSLVAVVTDIGTLEVAHARGSLSGLADRVIDEAESGLLGAAMGAERIEVVEGHGPRGSTQLVAGIPVSHAAVVPLKAHGVTSGVIAVMNHEGEGFTAESLRLLSTVATHAAIVLSNARYFDLMRASRDQWETTFNALADGVAVVDDVGMIRRANRSLGELMRRAESELAGMKVGAVFGDPAGLEDLLKAARTGQLPNPLLHRSEHLDMLLRIAATPLSGPGQTGWVVVLIEDITEQKAIEAQLIQSEKMGAVGQLVSGVAHELNNPLTSIAGLAEFLLEQPRPSERDRDHIKVIREQADRASRIVRNLLTFAHQGPADPGDLDLNDVVQRTVALVGYELKLREVRLDMSLARTLPRLYADRYQIQQVVVNLVTNAVQAVQTNPPDRPRWIRLRTSVEGDQVMLTVADSGPGVPEGVARQIFTPFFTTKDPGHGTGLGLSVSFRIVEGHGGSLSAGRDPEGGAQFIMRLPVRGAPSGAGPRVEDPARRDPGIARRILLLDDDPAVRRMITVLLSSDGHTVHAARDAEHAVTLLDEGSYDLVIADPSAPVSPGERFGDHVSRHRPEMSGRTILITADVRPETVAWLVELGCRFFVKPFRMSEIKTAATELLER